MSGDDATHGVTYVGWGRCLDEAIRSSASARRVGLKTCLITPDGYAAEDFDVVIPFDGKLSQDFNLVGVYELSPWTITLWLDTDTLVLDSLDFAFDAARSHGIATVIAPHSTLRGRQLSGIADDVPEYNCGAVWIDSSHVTMTDFGLKWRDIVDGYAGGGWWTDQSSLSVALYQLGINPYVLPLNWNFRPFMDREFSGGAYHTDHGFGPIKIWHSRSRVPEGFNPLTDQFWCLEQYRSKCGP